MKETTGLVAALSLLCLACSSAGTPPPETTVGAEEAASMANTSIWDGVFSDAQAERGRVLYDAQCASCHGRQLVSNAGAPNLTEPGFRFGWHGRTIAQRLDQIRSTMPQGFPESMTDQEYLDVIAYILQFNGYPVGSQELDADRREILERIVIEPPAQ